jgi:hypothetical protein
MPSDLASRIRAVGTSLRPEVDPVIADAIQTLRLMLDVDGARAEWEYERRNAPRVKGNGRTAAEMLRCAWCRAMVTTRWAECASCGHKPAGKHEWHRYA